MNSTSESSGFEKKVSVTNAFLFHFQEALLSDLRARNILETEELSAAREMLTEAFSGKMQDGSDQPLQSCAFR